MPFQKILSVVFFVFIGFRSFGYQISNPDNSSLIFIENKNQWSDDVYFSAQLPVGAIYLYDNSFRFFLTDVERLSHKHKKYEDRQLYENGDKACIEEKGIQNHSYNVNFVNANTKVSPFGKGKTKQYYNYFLGADSTKWASKAHGYTEVNYENLYNAIDLKVYSRYKLPKYDFVVRPGGNPSDILLQYNGVDDIYVFNDQLYIETSLGLVKEDVPVVYQIIDGERISVNAKYVLDCDVLSFQFPEGYNDHEELIIDPLLIFSTYSGSSADNWGNTATPGENGKFYSGGITNHFRGDGSGGSNFLGEFPSTIGAYQTTWGGIWDVAIIKYDSTGSQVEYATYLGGSGSEVPHSIIMDNDENLVIFGTTNSTDFPTTSNAYLKSFQGGVSHETILGEIFANGSDVFVAKLSKDGSQLMASTYFGGNGNDGQNLSISPLTKNYGDEQRGEVFIDEQNNIYISSVTNSKNLFDATPKSFDKSYNGGLSDAILVKFNSELSDVVFGGYFGGAGADASYAIKIGSDNTVYFAGGTDSHDLPITNGTLCETLNGNVDG